jgi:hypothetical protein
MTVKASPFGRCCAAVLLLVALITCSGCQTFNLSESDFHRQQYGEMADPETGRVVDTVGTAGYLGAMVGAAIAEATK